MRHAALACAGLVLTGRRKEKAKTKKQNQDSSKVSLGRISENM